MNKRIFLETGRIGDRRKNVKSCIFIKYTIGAKRFPIHDMATNNTSRRRKLYFRTIGKIDFIIDKESNKAMYKETKKDDYRKHGRLSQISQWRKLASHKYPLAN